MSMFENLNDDGLEEVGDRLGGYAPLETDIYTGTLKVAYAIQAASGAKGVALIADFGGKEYSETVYVTNKKGDNWFANKQDPKKKVPLPGFTLIDDLCQVTCEKHLSEMDMEDKVIKIRDWETKQDLPKSVPVLTELTGKTVSFAIYKNLENKSQKDASGTYVATAETRLTNNIEKVFHTESKVTVAEARQGKEEGEFWGKWLEHNKGKERDRRTVKDGQTAQSGRPSANRAPAGPPQAGQAATGRKSLFGGNKS